MRDKGRMSRQGQKDVLNETLKSLEELVGDDEPLTHAANTDQKPLPEPEPVDFTSTQPEQAEPASQPEPVQPVKITVTKTTPLQNESLDDFPILEDVAIVGRGKTHRFSRDGSAAATLNDGSSMSFPSEDLLTELIDFLNAKLDQTLDRTLDQKTETLLRDEIRAILAKWRRGHRDHGVR
ncbi:MAG TPA: hypothetical protein ENI80_11535 [Acidiferrobacteraceae bacterium]|nr:hypothetical protein [Acidiferrobacteraceae bacterium]